MRSPIRCLTALACSVSAAVLLLAPAAAQLRPGGTLPGTSTYCSVNGPDRVCGAEGGLSYSTTLRSPPGATFTWSLHTTTTDGCPGTGTTTPSFCGPTNLSTVCVVPGVNAGRFVLKVVVTYGTSTSTCCLSINVTATTSTTAPASFSTCAGSTHVFCTTASGTGPFTYSWTKNGVLIPGATDSCYNASTGPAGVIDNYCVTATGSGGCGASYTACGLLTSLANTTVLALPTPRRCEGVPFVFCATAGGQGPFTYSWSMNGSAIPGATDSCYTATAGTPGTIDSYCVTVDGECGPPITRCGTLTAGINTVTSSLTSASKCAGSTHTFCANATGQGALTYTWSKNSVAIPGATNSCYTATAGPDGTVDEFCVSVTGTCGTAQSCATLISTANTSTSNFDSASACQSTAQTFCVTAGGTGPFTYSWTKNTVVIPGATGSCYTATAGAAGTIDTYCASAAGPCGPPSSSCFELTATASTQVANLQPASGCAGSEQNLCVTASGTGPFTYAWSKNTLAIPGATNSCYTATAGTAGTIDTYCVSVAGSCGTVVPCTTVTALLGTTATALTSGSGCPGATHTFCTTAGGAGPFTYVWTKNGSSISGASSSCYTATVGASTDSYCVDVTGACGTVQRCASLSVNAATAATSLSETSGCVGEPVSFCTTASGTGPFTYQWTRNGVAVSGQTTSCFAFDLAPGDSQVCVTVTGACGPVVHCATLSAQACGGSHCTLTQGAYGNADGQFNGMARLALITDLLQGDMTVGVLGTRSLTFQAGVQDAQCVINRLPTSGTADTLPSFGDEFLESNCQTAPTPILLQSDRFQNILLGQVITLSLNVRLASGVSSPNGCTTDSTGISAQTICETMVSQGLNPGPDGCRGTADDTPSGGPNEPITIEDSVMDSLAALSLPQTVGGVLQLGNRALAGLSTGTATLSEVSAAVDSINILFDECRELVDCTDD